MADLPSLFGQGADVREVFDAALYQARQPFNEVVRGINFRLTMLEQKLATVTGTDPTRFHYPEMPMAHMRRRAAAAPPLMQPDALRTADEVLAHLHDVVARALACQTDDAGSVLIDGSIHKQLIDVAFRLGVLAGRSLPPG